MGGRLAHVGDCILLLRVILWISAWPSYPVSSLLRLLHSRFYHIGTNEIKSVLVKKPRISANYNKFIKSTLYSPSTSHRILCKSDFSGLDPLPLEANIAPTAEEMPNLILMPMKFGNALKGSPLSYQQKLSQEYVINDFLASDFPKLPLEDVGERIMNNVLVCLNQEKMLH